MFSFCRRLVVLVAVLAMGLTVECFAQQVGEVPGLPERVARYHEALLKRPAHGTLFERFCDGWLENGTAADLEKFFRLRAEGDGKGGLANDLLLTFFLCRQGDDAAALNVVEAGLKEARDEPKDMVTLAWYEKAKIAMRLSNLDGAEQDLAKAAELLGVGTEANGGADLVREVALLRGKLLARLGKRDQALAVWTELADRFPGDRDLRRDVIDLQAESGLYDQALAGVGQLIEGDGDGYEKALLQLRRVELLQSADRSEEAVAGLVEILAVTGQGSWIERETLARFERHFRSRGDLSGLAEALENRLQAEPQRLALLMARAQVLAELGEDEQALADWVQVLRLTPGQRAIRERYVAALSDMGRRDEAVAQQQRLIALDADDAELYAQLAELQWRNGDAEAASASVAKFVEVAGESEVNFVRAIGMLGQYRRTKAVETMYGRWLKLTPDSVAAEDGFAGFLYREGRREEAVARWKKLAEGTELAELLFVAGRLLGNSEGRAAYEILKQRQQEFDRDFAFLGKLAEAALLSGDDLVKEALPLARQRLALAEDDVAFSEAIGLAATAARRADDDGAAGRELLAELSAKAAPERSAVETCLLVELLRRAMRTSETEELLAAMIDAGKTDENDEAAVKWGRRELVRLYEGQQQFRKAAGILQEVVENAEGGVRGGDAAVLQTLANLARRAGDPVKARHWLNEWKKAVPGSAQPWMIEASVLEDDGNYEAALKILQDVARRFDDVDAVSSRLVEMYRKLGRSAEAEGVVWQLYREEEKPDRRLGWARRLVQLAAEADQKAGVTAGRGQGGRVDDLIDKFGERQRSNRRSLAPLRALAEVYEVINNREEQRRVLQQAAAIEPENIGILHELAGLSEAEGQTAEALRWLEQARRHDNTRRSVERLARVYLASGQFEKAAGLLREADGGKGSADLTAIEEMAVTLMTIGEWPRALVLLQHFVEDPALASDYRLHYLYALALEESERPDEAALAFRRCGAIERELPDSRRGSSVAFPVTGVEELDVSFLPLAAQEIQQASLRGMGGYSYRWGVPKGWMYGISTEYFGGSASGNQAAYLERFVPSSIEESQWWARTHLVTLAVDDDGEVVEEGRDAWAALRSEGFSEVLLSVLAAAGKAGKGVPQVSAILDQRYAEDFLYQASRLADRSVDVSKEGSEKVLQAMRLFEKQQRSDLAVLSGLRMSGQLRDALPEEAEVVHRETVRLLKEWQQPLRGQIFVEWMAAVLQRLEGADGGVENFSEEELAVVRERVLSWVPSANDRRNSEEFWQVMMALSHVADSAAMTAKLEEYLQRQAEIEPTQAGPKDLQSLILASQLARRLYYGDNGRKHTDLVLTPEYPPEFLAALKVYIDNGSGKRLMNEEWASFVAEVEDDVLAACLSDIVQLPDELSIRLERMRADDEIGISEAYVLGEKAEDEWEWSTALQWFEKMRELAVAGQSDSDADDDMAVVRQLADMSIMSLGSEQPRGQEVREAGREALLRLVAEQNPPIEVSLAAVVGVGQYGFENQLHREMVPHRAAVMKLSGRQSRPASFSSGRWNSYRGISGQQPTGSVLAQIASLAENGRKDALVRVVADMLPSLTQRRLSMYTSRHHQISHSQAKAPLPLIKTQKLEDQLVAEVRSRLIADEERATDLESGNFVRRARLGALCLELGRWQEAADIFGKLREQRPGDRLVRLRLVEALCGVEGGTTEALAELRKLAAEESVDEPLFGQLVDGLLFSARNVGLRLGVVEMMISHLEQEELEDERGALWMKLRTVIASAMEDDKVKLKALSVRGHRPHQSSRTNRPMVERREILYEKLCRVAMTDPQLAAEGFSGLYLLHDLGKDGGDLLDEARKALAVMDDAVFVTSGARIDANGSQRSNHETNREADPFAPVGRVQKVDRAERLGPIQVLVAEAAQVHKPEWIYDEVLPMLEARGEQGAELHAAVKAWADLWFCKGAQFPAAVNALREVPGLGDSVLFWEHLERVGSKRTEITFDLGEELLLTLRDPQRRPMAIKRLGGYLDQLFERGGEELVTGYLRRLFAEVASEFSKGQQAKPAPERFWQEESSFDRSSDASNNVFRALAAKPKFAMPTLIALSETDGVDGWPVEMVAILGSGWGFSRLSRDERANFLQRVASFDTLLDLPLLMEEETEPEIEGANADSHAAFRRLTIDELIALGSTQRRATLLGLAINSVASGSTDDIGVMQVRVKEFAKATPFGRRLVAALLPEKGKVESAEPGDLVEIFVESRKEIEALPDGRRRALARLAMDLLAGDRLSRKPEQVEIIRWLAGEAGDHRLEFLDHLIAMKSFEDLAMSQSEVVEELKSALPYLLVVDPVRTRRAYENVLQLAEPGEQSSRADPFGRQQEVDAALGMEERIFQQPLFVVEAMSLAELALRKNPQRALRSGFFDQMTTPLEQQLPSKGDADELLVKRTEWLKEMLLRLDAAGGADAAKGVWTTQLISVFDRAHAGGEALTVELIEWLEGSPDALSEKLREEVLAAAWLRRGLTYREKVSILLARKQEPPPDAGKEFLAAVAAAEGSVVDALTDEKTPLEVRLGLCDFWLKKGGARNRSPVVVAAAREVLADCWKVNPGAESRWVWSWVVQEVTAVADEASGIVPDWWHEKAGALAEYLRVKYFDEEETAPTSTAASSHLQVRAYGVAQQHRQQRARLQAERQQVVPSLFALYVDLGKNGALMTCLREHPDLLNPVDEIWLMLVRKGMFEAANELLAQRRSDLGRRKLRQRFDAELAFRTEEYLASIDGFEDRILAKTLLVSLRDPDDVTAQWKEADPAVVADPEVWRLEGYPSDWKPWQQRMMDLAATVEKQATQLSQEGGELSEPLRLRILSSLSEHSPTLGVVKSFVPETVAGMSLTRLERIADQSRRGEMHELLNRVLAVEVEAGEFNRWFQLRHEARLLAENSASKKAIENRLDKVPRDLQSRATSGSVDMEILVDFRAEHALQAAQSVVDGSGDQFGWQLSEGGLEELNLLIGLAGSAMVQAGDAMRFPAWLQEIPESHGAAGRLLCEAAWLDWPDIRGVGQKQAVASALRRKFREKKFPTAADWPGNFPLSAGMGGDADFGDLLVERFLKANQVSEWRTPDKFTSSVVQLLKLLAERPNRTGFHKAEEVYLHAVRLQEEWSNGKSKEVLEKLKWTFGNGWTYPASLVDQLISSGHGLAELDLGLTLLDVAEEAGEVLAIHSWSGNYNHRNRLVLLLASEGLSFELQGPLQRSVERLGAVIGERSPDAQAKIFWELIACLELREREALVKLVVEKMPEVAKGSAPNYWMELALALAFADSIAGRELSLTADWRRHYLQLLKDETLPESRRFSLLQHWLAKAGPAVEIEPAAVFAGMDLASRLAERDGSVHGYVLSILVRRFGRGIDREGEHADEWQAAASRMLSVWSRITDSEATADEPEQGTGYPVFAPELDAILSMRELAQLAGDAVAVVEIDERFGDALIGNSRMLAHHVRFGEFDHALKLIERNRSWMSSPYFLDEVKRENARTHYSAELASRTAEFLPKIEDEGTRYLVSGLLAVSPDPESWELDSQGEFPPRAERMQLHSRRYPGVKFPGLDVRVRALAEATLTVDGTIALREELQATARDVSLAEVSKASTKLERDENVRILAGAVLADLLAGEGKQEGQTFSDVISLLEKESINNAADHARDHLLRLLKGRLREDFLDLSRKERERWRDVYRARIYRALSWPKTTFSRQLAAAAVLLEATAEDKWNWPKLVREVNRRLVVRVRSDRDAFFLDLRDLLFDPGKFPHGPLSWSDEDRLALVTALMEDEILEQVFEGSSRMYREMILAGWIDEDELLENAKKWSAAMPRGGLAMVEMTEIYCLRDELAEATAWLESARRWYVENSTAGDATARRQQQWRFHLAEAGLVIRRGKLLEAAEMLSGLSPVVPASGLQSNSIKHLLRLQEPLGLRRLLEVAKREGVEPVPDDPDR